MWTLRTGGEPEASVFKLFLLPYARRSHEVHYWGDLVLRVQWTTLLTRFAMTSAPKALLSLDSTSPATSCESGYLGSRVVSGQGEVALVGKGAYSLCSEGLNACYKQYTGAVVKRQSKKSPMTFVAFWVRPIR